MRQRESDGPSAAGGRRGFTMIELIFAIVIIGILAIIGIPKMSATRDDARTVTVVNNLAECISYAGGAYTARQKTSLTANSCTRAKRCFDVVMGNNDENNGSIFVYSGTGVRNAPERGANYCINAYRIAEKNALASPGGTEHFFGGMRVNCD